MGYDLYTERSHAYLRVGFFRMPLVRDAMRSLSMLADLPAPEFPDVATFGVSVAQLQTFAPGDENAPVGVREYRAARRATVEQQAENPAGIPDYKLCSNDAWLISPEELTAALAVYDAASEPDRAHAAAQAMDTWSDWADWIEYLRYAATDGGVRVL